VVNRAFQTVLIRTNDLRALCPEKTEKRRIVMRKIILTLIMTLIPVALFAQLETLPEGALVPGASFITALVVGIILAFGFQLILMNLSAAAGLSVLHSPLESVRKRVGAGGAAEDEK